MCVWELEDKSFMLVWEHLQIYWGFGFVNVYCVCEVHESSCNLYFYSKFSLGQEKIISFGLQRGKKKWQSNLPTQSMTSSVHSDRVLKRGKKKKKKKKKSQYALVPKTVNILSTPRLITRIHFAKTIILN